MFIIVLSISVFCLVSGFLYLLDTVVWNLEAGENFLEYGILYAETRHNFYIHEIAFSGIIILFGIILLFIAMRYIRKRK